MASNEPEPLANGLRLADKQVVGSSLPFTTAWLSKGKRQEFWDILRDYRLGLQQKPGPVLAASSVPSHSVGNKEVGRFHNSFRKDIGSCPWAGLWVRIYHKDQQTCELGMSEKQADIRGKWSTLTPKLNTTLSYSTLGQSRCTGSSHPIF